MIQRALRALLLFLARHPALPAFLVALVAGEAFARPGGGHSFSSSSHSSSSHSGGSWGGSSSGSSGYSSHGGGDSSDFFLVWLLFSHPSLGVPLLIVAFIWVMANRQNQARRGDWSTTTPERAPPTLPVRRQLAALRAADPAFSTVLFEDFLYALYATAHESRGGDRLEALAPYLSTPARAALRSLGPADAVTSVVIGALRFESASGLTGQRPARVVVGIEANYTERSVRGQQAFWTEERWVLMRLPGARSRPPDKVRVFGCPSCGAPLDAVRGNVCSYCGKRVDPGTFDWQVESIEVVSRERRGPQLTGTTEEQGTLSPTVLDPDLQGELAALESKDPGFSWAALEARVRLIHAEFNAGWSARDLLRVRPFLSDSLFQMQLYWVETYRQQGLRNAVSDAQVRRVQLAAVESDPVYDAITVRVFATGFDYTEDESGKIVGGSRTRRRDYTEYWTLIRGSGRTGAAKAETSCPNCGAPLKVNMTGTCEYCQAKVASGDFDWVLSRIEQDETYGS